MHIYHAVKSRCEPDMVRQNREEPLRQDKSANMLHDVVFSDLMPFLVFMFFTETNEC
jgi:hypothetical protein